jgi:uncharacterized protein (TIGR02145 family)
MLIQEVLMNMKRGCLVALSALFAAAFFACSDSSNPGLPENDVSAVGNADDGSPVSKTVLPEEENAAPEPVVQDDSADESSADESPAVGEEPSSSSSEESVPNEPESSSSIDSTAFLDSILTIIFPDGVDGVDTARHDPDSVGVWHFYDPRGTHDNPDFAYGEMTDARDGNVYKTTTIGGQVWMAENLNYFDIEGAASSIKNDWCYWDKPENCESAGRLYTWNVAQRICPEGWRLPTKSDWESLLQEVGADSLNEILWKGSSKLKSKSGWENDGSGTDDFGFTALPAGMKFTTSTQDGFTYHGCSSLMWAATEADGGAADTLAYHMYLDCSNDNAIVNTVRKINGLSVRCVKE